ncbi:MULTISPECIES: DSD1 family PLP-dependent enzyme [unclassified Cupriavidus]|uniref:DSD1 family PLP-dependent enzyme n=1 Tax=unclassified Cupriavidus TaxID=2640874 RepID=UPI00040CE019|nr:MULTISPECIES: DSD1 family PLP-dependent enzyme [unclassified Cupriavidus]MBP0631651.1 DSD1 family PLP-dependent enzyme [Cupriavidus sp. AcVe19-1a]MBP0637504.1 DSD1 family PLP-dependent enzyme [Cupriavidus sp. AcVe19-6a]
MHEASVLRPPHAAPGQSLSALSTPALLIELDAFEANLARMAELAERAGVALRPHAKAHKSVAIAQRQVDAGAVGICCQKLSEAYPFAAAGIGSIHLSNEFVGADKAAMAAELARHTRLSICVDDVRQVSQAGVAAARAGVRIAVLPEVDVGQGRCGVASDEALLALIDAIDAEDALDFGGLQGYHGGIQHIEAWAQRREAAQRAAEATAGYLRALERRGLRCPVVTGGGTGTAEFDLESGVYTEIQPGSYLFLDGHYGSLEWEGALRPLHSLFVASTVMSAARAGVAVCDVGLKSVAVDSGLPHVWPRDADGGLEYVAANDEHGVLAVTGADSRDLLGERLWLVPGHCDPTANLHDAYACVRGERVEAVWAIEARGLSR